MNAPRIKIGEYTPRPDSVAERAMIYLQHNGPTSNSELADAIDAEHSAITVCLSTAVKYGAIVKGGNQHGLVWSIGQGVPLEEGAAEPAAPAPAAPGPAPAPPAPTAAHLTKATLPETISPVAETKHLDRGTPVPVGDTPRPVETPVDLLITLSIQCTPHQAERISQFVRTMTEVRG